MKCPVCGSEAKKIDNSGADYLEVDCPGCKHFGIADTLLKVQRNRVFDVERTRYFLENMPRGNSPIPILSTLDEELLYVPA